MLFSLLLESSLDREWMISHEPALYPPLPVLLLCFSLSLSVFGIAAVRISELSYGKLLGPHLQPQALVLVRAPLKTVSIRDAGKSCIARNLTKTTNSFLVCAINLSANAGHLSYVIAPQNATIISKFGKLIFRSAVVPFLPYSHQCFGTLA